MNAYCLQKDPLKKALVASQTIWGEANFSLMQKNSLIAQLVEAPWDSSFMQKAGMRQLGLILSFIFSNVTKMGEWSNIIYLTPMGESILYPASNLFLIESGKH